MNILEHEIEDIIFNALQNHPEELRKRGFYVSPNKIYLRQVEIGAYGRADIIGFVIMPKKYGTRDIYIHVVEIKKDAINHQTLFQALRYCRGVERYLGLFLNDINVHFSITLIGKTIDKNSDFVYAADVFDRVELLTYSVDFNLGVKFERQSGFYLTNESFQKVEKFKPIIKKSLIESVKRERDLPF